MPGLRIGAAGQESGHRGDLAATRRGEYADWIDKAGLMQRESR
jgi:hypothetical protein